MKINFVNIYCVGEQCPKMSVNCLEKLCWLTVFSVNCLDFFTSNVRSEVMQLPYTEGPCRVEKSMEPISCHTDEIDCFSFSLSLFRH